MARLSDDTTEHAILTWTKFKVREDLELDTEWAGV
ncbi:hypothetical protein PENANT_c035G01019 [Penicillium antarcticum]|uniref:Uncharacterized protein n=1 Tax=Penicillium antarcticum TaxID=416450 RepID=A0A1V6PTV2_9EURO|nr:hypothetical protein PENANT_c035G01019 [Penicillium antarcticum]